MHLFRSQFLEIVQSKRKEKLKDYTKWVEETTGIKLCGLCAHLSDEKNPFLPFSAAVVVTFR